MKKATHAELEKCLAIYMNEIITLIHKHVPDAIVYLFGSRARKDYKEGADIDIAIQGATPLSIDTISRLYEELEYTTIPVSVDFVDFNRTSPELLHRIQQEGIVWNK
jgi:predicted nucleotidyltransferase